MTWKTVQRLMSFYVITFFFLIILLTLLTIQLSYGDTESNSLIVKWHSSPVIGVAYYQVQKLVSGDDDFVILNTQIPSTTIEIDGKKIVEFFLLSKKEESYQIRVRGVSMEGKHGRWSNFSDVVHVKTKSEILKYQR